MVGLYRVGGISAIVLGISYVVITALYALGGALPIGTEEWLKQHLAGLYITLKEANRNAALAGASLIAIFSILDLAVTWPNYSSLITLSGNYTAATNEVQRTVIVAAATYASSVLTSRLFAVYAILVPSLGILIMSLVMLKGAFNKVTAYSGVAAGITGIVAVVGRFIISALGTSAIAASVLATVWVLLVGVRLCKGGIRGDGSKQP